MSEEVKEEVATPETLKAQVSDHLALFPGAPSRDQVEAWKKQHGEVNCSGFNDTEIYIWRTVKRAEWIVLQKQLAQLGERAADFDLEQEVVKLCLLWATEAGEEALLGKAGSLTTLHEQIMQNSNFVNPSVVGNLVIKL